MKKIMLSLLLILSLSTVSFADEKMHFHGYGEMHYNSSNKPGNVNKMDFHRFVLGWTYKFKPNIILNAEIDFEHAAKELELELAQIDFLISDLFNTTAT